MSNLANLSRAILENERFKQALNGVTIRSLLGDLPTIVAGLPPANVDWNHALACASALVSMDGEQSIDAALRVTQGSFDDELAGPEHRRAAAVLLERMGNSRALALAERRDLVEKDAWGVAPWPLQIDVVRRQLALTIPLSSGERVRGNEFQRGFWTDAERHKWLSVSAPTSAGKSYIVKKWFEERAASSESFCGVYLVPTRALIDEVSRDLRSHFGDAAEVFVLPWDREHATKSVQIYVLTQERLHLLQESDPFFALDLLFLDEAQKFGDDSRGVLLQRVLDEAVRRRPSTQVIFASPSSQNPEILLDGAPPESRPQARVSESVTVNQNLLWVNRVAGDSKRWSVDLLQGGEPQPVGHIDLPASSTQIGTRLPLVAVAMGGIEDGNVVYVNGAAEAEKAAGQIASSLARRVDLSDNPTVVALQELIAETVHPEYHLPEALTRGVAFHYGNMPLLVRTQIEQLFREGTLHYLVCTSTLLEGVNLPCRNLFARAPTKGSGTAMTIPDFWNLAGRAGRWGQEFRGNIVCVEATPEVWENLPRRKERQPIKRASDEVLSDLQRLESFIVADSPADAARENPLLASVYGFLATRVGQEIPIDQIPGVELSQADCASLENTIRGSLSNLEIPVEIIGRHPGISPRAMRVLLDYFRGHPKSATLPVRLPGYEGAWLSYAKALSRSHDYLGAKFGGKSRCAMLGILLNDWMRGHPLRRLIDERIRYARSEKRSVDTTRTIRETMDDVEQIARFLAPKYLACYLDIHTIFLTERSQEPTVDSNMLTKMLELGVSRPVEVSLMGLGLSRTSAMTLSGHIEDDEMSRDETLAWIQAAPLDAIKMPTLVRKEIEQVLEIEASDQSGF